MAWKHSAVLDESVPASVVLVPRSMGIPIPGPVVARVAENVKRKA